MDEYQFFLRFCIKSLCKISPKSPILQSSTICGLKTNLMTYHYFHVCLLRALSRMFWQIKLSNFDLYYKIWIKILIFEILDHAKYVPKTHLIIAE